MVGETAERAEVGTVGARGFSATGLAIEAEAELVLAIGEDPFSAEVAFDEDVSAVLLGNGLAIVGPVARFATSETFFGAL